MPGSQKQKIFTGIFAIVVNLFGSLPKVIVFCLKLITGFLNLFDALISKYYVYSKK